MSIVRPRRLLYLAIDGVAPRAKMNQQRSRRFRAARESQQNDERKRKLREEYMRNGMWTQEIEDYVNRKSFDSNVITPGT
jgi:5'-3' exonuclease